MTTSSNDDLVASCLALAAKDIVAVITANRYMTILDGGKSHLSHVESGLASGRYEGAVVLEQLWLGNISFQLCGVMFQTAALRAIGGFATGHPYAGDVRTYASLFVGRRVAFEAAPKCTYVVHPKSESSLFGLTYRLDEVSHVFAEIIGELRERLPRSQAARVAASVRRYVTTEYFRNIINFYEAGGGRGASVAAAMPGLRWMAGRGGRPGTITWRFVDRVLLPPWMRRLVWGLQRASRAVGKVVRRDPPASQSTP